MLNVILRYGDADETACGCALRTVYLIFVRLKNTLSGLLGLQVDSVMKRVLQFGIGTRVLEQVGYL